MTKQNLNSKVIAIVNQKGGVGKTTTVTNLSTALAAVGKKILLIDLDPQGNATTNISFLEKFEHRNQYNIYRTLFGQNTIDQAIYETKIENLDIVTSSIELSSAEIELHNMEEGSFVLNKILQTQKLKYDFIIIDCPPALGMLTLNALCAANSIIIPVQCEFFALEGLSHLIRTYNAIKQHKNKDLYIEGILLTMYDKRNKLTFAIEKEIRSHFGSQTFKSIITRNVTLSESASHGQPSILYDINCAGSKCYIDLAKEIIINNKITF